MIPVRSSLRIAVYQNTRYRWAFHLLRADDSMLKNSQQGGYFSYADALAASKVALAEYNAGIAMSQARNRAARTVTRNRKARRHAVADARRANR